MLTTKKIDNSIEKLIVTGMITSDRFLKEIQTIYRPDFVSIPFVRTIAKWCLDYWKKYEKSPGIHIQDLFNSHSRNGLGEDMSELINSFLSSISHEYERSEQFNVDYLLSQAEIRFKECSLKNLAEDIQACLTDKETGFKEAEKLLVKYKHIERPQSKGINPLTNREAIYRAFEKREESVLFQFPGALGVFVGPINRSTLTAVMGSSKRGKSYYLIQFAMWAIEARCNVAFFEVGDMSETDIIRRMNFNNTRSSDLHWGEVTIPVLDCAYNQSNECIKKERLCAFGVARKARGEGEEWEMASLEDSPNYIPCTLCSQSKEFKGAVWYKRETIKKLNWKQAWEEGKKTMSRTGGKEFMLSVYPNDSVNVQGIETQLDQWEQSEGFVPDVIIIDYADILAPIDSRLDERGRHNQTWKALRALSQKRCCAVFTATQANAASYEKKSIGESNFSEDKRKYDHATGFLTLNQTSEEKKAGIIRIGEMFFREKAFNTKRHCTVGQCLDIGKPYLFSYL